MRVMSRYSKELAFSFQSLDIRDIELYYETREFCEQVYRNAPGQLVKPAMPLIKYSPRGLLLQH
jgi:hypothetical protein